MAVSRKAGYRSKRAPKSTSSGGELTPTPPPLFTENGTSITYGAGDTRDPARIIQLATESENRAAARAGSAEGETADVGAVGFDEVGTTDIPSPSEGPLTPPTTYGVGEMPKPGAQKRVGQGKAAKSQKLLKRISKTTGSSKGEARGIMKKARGQVRRGNTAGAKRTITRALAGGKSAGVPRSPKRSAKAAQAATKITKRIETRQTSRKTTVKRRKK